jgi:hypothetical protein
MMSYSRKFCARSHRRYTVCAQHVNDRGPCPNGCAHHEVPDWRDCPDRCAMLSRRDATFLWCAAPAAYLRIGSASSATV